MKTRLRFALVTLAAVGLAGPALAQDNLVVNGQFDSGIEGWTLGPASSGWSATDRNGTPGSGSASITNSVRRNDQGLSQCFPTTAGTRVEFGAWALLSEDATEDARAIVVAIQYESEDCTDGAVFYTYSNKARTLGEWAEQNTSITTQHGIRSVRMHLAPYPNVDDLEVTALYDDAYYREVAYGEFVLNPSMASSWYDPLQSGHGVMLHVLDRFRVWMCWFTFDAMGDPSWICALGRSYGMSTTMIFEEAFIMEGGMFPPDFDPDMVNQVPWGRIEIEFTACNEGVMRWTTDVPGYSDGEMPLRRLTSLWDNPCGD